MVILDDNSQYYRNTNAVRVYKMEKNIQPETYENVLVATDAERKRFDELLASKTEKTIEKTFLLHWIGQDEPEEIKGETVARAFTIAGYGAGAITALDWYEEII